MNSSLCTDTQLTKHHKFTHLTLFGSQLISTHLFSAEWFWPSTGWHYCYLPCCVSDTWREKMNHCITLLTGYRSRMGNKRLRQKVVQIWNYLLGPFTVYIIKSPIEVSKHIFITNQNIRYINIICYTIGIYFILSKHTYMINFVRYMKCSRFIWSMSNIWDHIKLHIIV